MHHFECKWKKIYPPILSCSRFKFQFSLFNTILLNTLIHSVLITTNVLLPRYNWNIVESGVKHHKPNQANVMSLNSVHGEVYSIQHYAIILVSYLRQVGGFLLVLWVPLPIKNSLPWYNWNIVVSDIKHQKPSQVNLFTFVVSRNGITWTVW